MTLFVLRRVSLSPDSGHVTCTRGAVFSGDVPAAAGVRDEFKKLRRFMALRGILHVAVAITRHTICLHGIARRCF